MAVCLSSRSLMHSGSVNLRHGELEDGPVVVASISGRGSAGSFKENSCWNSSSLGLRQRSQSGKRFTLRVISKGGSDQSLSTTKGKNSNSPQIQILQRSPSAFEWSEMIEGSKSTSSFNVKESGIQPLHTQDEDGNAAGEGNNEMMFKEDHDSCLGKTATTSKGPLAERWREIQGERQWKGLLTPEMDSVLRAEILKCGEFAQANYDAFDYEPTSKYCGSSRFNKKKLLENVGLQNSGYEVTKFLYAMADVNVPKFFRHSSIVTDDETWSRHSNWMGFIAVATDEKAIRRLGRRDIMVSWRGTVMALEWMENLRDILAPTSPGHREGRVVDGCNRKVKVERGFLSLYNSKDATTKYNKNSAAEQVKMEIQRLVELYSHEELSITITGHSLGGALATLSAYDIANSNCTQRPQVKLQKQTTHNKEAAGHDEPDASSRLDNIMSIPITAFTFASPRVGNDAFRDRMLELGVHVLRIENKFDIVPKVPGLFVNERAFTMFGGLEQLVSPWLDRIPWTYTHVGEEVKLDQTRSASLKTKKDYANSHNLELYLHLLSIYQGPKLPYKEVSDRDIALVNKSCNQLKDKLRVPACWFQSKNKGMEQHMGRWVLPDRADDEVPKSDAHNDWV